MCCIDCKRSSCNEHGTLVLITHHSGKHFSLPRALYLCPQSKSEDLSGIVHKLSPPSTRQQYIEVYAQQTCILLLITSYHNYKRSFLPFHYPTLTHVFSSPQRTRKTRCKGARYNLREHSKQMFQIDRGSSWGGSLSVMVNFRSFLLLPDQASCWVWEGPMWVGWLHAAMKRWECLHKWLLCMCMFLSCLFYFRSLDLNHVQCTSICLCLFGFCDCSNSISTTE